AVSGAAPTRETIVPKTMANLATPGRRGRGPWGDHVRSLARRPVARAGRNRPGAGARAPRGGGPRLRSLRRKRYGPPCGDGSALRPAGRCAADDAPGTPGVRIVVVGGDGHLDGAGPAQLRRSARRGRSAIGRLPARPPHRRLL